jgi:hypothetical protein
VIDTTQTRSLFGPPMSLVGIKKRVPLFWIIFWPPQGGRRQVPFSYKRGHPFFPRSLFSAMCLQLKEFRAELGCTCSQSYIVHAWISSPIWAACSTCTPEKIIRYSVVTTINFFESSRLHVFLVRARLGLHGVGNFNQPFFL